MNTIRDRIAELNKLISEEANRTGIMSELAFQESEAAKLGKSLDEVTEAEFESILESWKKTDDYAARKKLEERPGRPRSG